MVGSFHFLVLSEQKVRLAERLRPRQVLGFAQDSGIAFVPLSPCIEWHSYHLPLGVDGIIAEEVARILAEEFDGMYFRTISVGLDQERDAGFRAMSGLPSEGEIFGMNFPQLPLESEYAGEEELRALLSARVSFLKKAGFRRVFVVNHHGGGTQKATIEEVAKGFSGDGFAVQLLHTSWMGKFPVPEQYANYMGVGGHAGLAETIQFMAFCPELVDFSELPAGDLLVSEAGILHNAPEIPEKFHPKNAPQELADSWREAVLADARKKIQTCLISE